MRRFRATVPAVCFVALFVCAPALLSANRDLHTYPAADFKDNAYMQKVHQKVGMAWTAPAETPKEGSKSDVIVTILRDGSLIESRLHMQSGSEAWDASALEAVKKAAPFEPLPKSYPRTSVEVHFHFEWNP